MATASSSTGSTRSASRWTASLDAVAYALSYARPHVFHHHGGLLNASPPSSPAASNWSLLASANYVHGAALLDGLELSLPALHAGAGAATPLRLYAKTHLLSADMVSNVLAPSLATSLWSQSWLNTGGVLGSACPAQRVDGGGGDGGLAGVSVLDATFLSPGAPASEWPTADDHSKWAVAALASQPWSCANDNNRAHSQLTRSGLSACLDHPALHQSLRAVVAGHHACPPAGPPNLSWTPLARRRGD